MDCFNNGDGTARVTYTVSQPGEYAVHILYEDEDIPNSPYMPMIHPNTGDINPDRVSFSFASVRLPCVIG